MDALSRETGQQAAVVPVAGSVPGRRRSDSEAVHRRPEGGRLGIGTHTRQTAGLGTAYKQGAARDAHRPARARTPFSDAELESVSRACSISARRVYGKARVCRLWGVARSTHYARQAAGDSRATGPGAPPGPQASVVG